MVAAMGIATKAKLELEVQALEEQRKKKKRVRRNVWFILFCNVVSNVVIMTISCKN